MGNEKIVFPQILNEFIFIKWPVVKEIVDGFNVVQVDASHNVDAQAPLPAPHASASSSSSTPHGFDPISAEEMLGANPPAVSDEIAGWVADLCNDYVPEYGGKPEDEHDGFADWAFPSWDLGPDSCFDAGCI